MNRSPATNQARVASRTRRRSDRWRWGFSLVELLVVIVILATLVSLMIPAISSARAAAQRMQCQANLRSIGQAILATESGRGRLPYGRNEERYYDHSWATWILPRLEEQALFDAYDFRRRWNDDRRPTSEGTEDGESTPPLAATEGDGESAEGDDHATKPSDAEAPRTNLEIAETDIAVFQCPSVSHSHRGAIDYGGNYGTSLNGWPAGFQKEQGWAAGVLIAINLQRVAPNDTHNKGIRLADIRDGASHTFMVMENAGRPADEGGQWANGHNCFSQDRPYINIQPSNEIFSEHRGVAHVLMADGSLMALEDDIDHKVLGALATRAGGEYIELED